MGFNITGIYNSQHSKAVQLHTVIDNILKEKKNVTLVVMGDLNLNTSSKINTPLCDCMKENCNCDQ